MSDWRAAPIAGQRIGPVSGLVLILRIALVFLVTHGGLLVLLALRLVERPLFGVVRPWTPAITQRVCKASLRIMGLRLKVRGSPMRQKGAVVANHGSWLDIFVLNAVQRIYFVAKSEVSAWALIGWLARATGTVFIARKSTEAAKQKQLFEERLRAGHKLLFFPEGTSTDTLRVLPFKSTLFAAFYADGLAEILYVQPVTVVYHAPEGADPRSYGWWAEMSFAEHFIQTLSLRKQGSVEVIFHPEVPVAAFASRKDLAAHCERVIRTAHPLAAAG